MKALLLFAGLLLAAGPAARMATPTLTLAASAPDTVAAIHRLFAARRQRRNFIAVGAVGGALVGTAAASNHYDRFFTTADYGKLYGLGALLIVAVDFVATMDYSRREERLAISDFEAQRLSPRLKRRLKARYFR